MSQIETKGFGKRCTFKQLKLTSALNTRGQAFVFNLRLRPLYLEALDLFELGVLFEELRLRPVGVQAQKQGFKLKALVSFSQANFETACFQARVELAPPHRLRAHLWGRAHRYQAPRRRGIRRAAVVYPAHTATKG